MNRTAIEIGRTIREARLNKGYSNRSAFVQTRKLSGKITGEGLRKIEEGERVPKFHNLRLLADALDLSDDVVRSMEKKALKTNVERVTRRAGNIPVSFKIDGEPMKIATLPPHRKVEGFARDVVEELVKLVDKYGVLPEDLVHFRRHARHVLLKRLDPT